MSTASKKAKKASMIPVEAPEVLPLKKDGSFVTIEDGDKIYRHHIRLYHSNTARGLPMVETGGSKTWFLAASMEQICEAASEYVDYLAIHNPTEFVAMVGSDAALVQWAFGYPGMVGEREFRDVNDFVESYAEPEKACDMFLFRGSEPQRVAKITQDISDAIGFVPTLAMQWA